MVFSKFLNTRKKACPVCGKKFDCDPLDLSRHVEQHFASSNHAEDDALLARAIADIEAEDAVIIPLSPHTTDQPPSVPIFTCPICHNTLLDTPEQRMEHEQLHAEMDAVTYSSSASSPTHDTSDTTYRCPRCDQIVPITAIQEHDDEHVAMELQNQLIAQEGASTTASPEIPPPMAAVPAYQTLMVTGVIPELRRRLASIPRTFARLCHPSIVHLCNGTIDRLWGCGYRNMQMMMSVLVHLAPDRVPCIMEIQEIQQRIEYAWSEGWDVIGARQLGGVLYGRSTLIGTTEAYTLFSHMGIKCRIFDFHRPTGPRGQHDELFKLVEAYFCDGPISQVDPTEPAVHITNKPPLYLQHQGHSRTIVGIERTPQGQINLLLFDPGQNISTDTRRHTARWLKPIRCDAKTIAYHRQYSILRVDLEDVVTDQDRIVTSVRIP